MITDNYSHFVVATSYIWFFLISSTVIGKIFLTTFPAFSYDFLSLSIFQLCEKLLTLNPLSANSIKWSNPLKQFAWNLLANRLSVFHHFVGLALKVIRVIYLYTIKLWNYSIFQAFCFVYIFLLAKSYSARKNPLYAPPM